MPHTRNDRLSNDEDGLSDSAFFQCMAKHKTVYRIITSFLLTIWIYFKNLPENQSIWPEPKLSLYPVTSWSLRDYQLNDNNKRTITIHTRNWSINISGHRSISKKKWLIIFLNYLWHKINKLTDIFLNKGKLLHHFTIL